MRLEVVDHLQDHHEALKAISLSLRIFLHHARKHLFAAFVLQAQDRKDAPASSLPSHKMFRLIKSAPHLIPYIQVLKIAGSSAWLRLEEEFSTAFGLFQQILEAEIETSALRHLYLYHIVWSDLSIDVQVAIQRFLGYRSLEKLPLISLSTYRGLFFTKRDSVESP
ncbi:hypothetical protein M378DRAFT_12330 [Amanita muscaria Koide BX008]|uniref:Uncharacterized protein n=1 Tax=Amanita muscaria (strain Koide BX008) TaxID=946122 RepID=A0A0C2X304_AMAMK|nr:hypothetical protein M378DRAFT_12330 [Amanita muscaria Koide BX008]